MVTFDTRTGRFAAAPKSNRQPARGAVQGWPERWLRGASGLLTAGALALSGCDGGPAARKAEHLGVAQSALVAATAQVTVTVPAGVPIPTLPVGASGDLRISDRARVQTASLTPAPVVNSGGTLTQLGFDSNVGTTTSRAPVTMLDRARVTGNVVSSGSVTRGSSTVVTGTVLQNTPITFDTWSWKVSLPASGAPVSVPVNGTRNLSPGSYASVQAFSGARLNLVAGTYYFDQLQMEPQSRIGADTRNGTITIYVRQAFTFRGSTVFTGPNDRLMIVYLGTAAPALDKSFDGTLVAPSASVRLGVGGSPYYGSIFAKSVQLDPDVRFTQRTFSGWNQFLYMVEPRFDCLEQRPGGAYVGHFGFRNPGTSSVTIPVGAGNRFGPGVENRQQPTVFPPGTFSHQFAVTWVTHPASWFLNGIEAPIDPMKVCPSTTAFSSVADTKVLASSPKANYGALTELRASSDEHTLVQFDRAAIAKDLGPNRLIASARLELQLVTAPTGPIRVTAMRQGWTEGGATWSCGADTDPTASGQSCTALDQWLMVRRDGTWENPWQFFAEPRPANIGTVLGSTISFDVTEDAQRFLGAERVGSAPGWILESAASGVGGTFHSREAGAALAPRLIVTPNTFTDIDVVQGGDAMAPLSFAVDSTVVPVRPALQSMVPGGPMRPLEAVRGPDNQQVEFAGTELIVYTASDTELAAVQSRLNATLVHQTPQAISGLERASLLKIDLTKASPATLAPSIVARIPGIRGRQRASSDGALRLLAALADESGRGTRVNLVWAGSGAGFGINELASHALYDGTFDNEPPTTTMPVPTNNAFDWPHFGPSMHDITGAWMEAYPTSTGTDFLVSVAIQDQGFAADMIDGYELAAPLCPVANCQNVGSCTGGSPCPWHGTDVANVGFGQANNAFGAAGPGFGVSELSLFFGLYDPLTMSAFLAGSLFTGQDILNMSYGAPIPDWAIGAASVLTLGGAYLAIEAGTWTVRHVGDTLIFAAAGNDHWNVDKMRCYEIKEPISDFVAGQFGLETALQIEICPWEEAWYWPCENAGVNCVEGSNYNDHATHDDSNYGADSVMHRASFVNITAGMQPDPFSGEDEANQILDPSRSKITRGTSSSSPLVAGMAALTWAVDRLQSASDVEACLFRAGKFVNARDSVRCALGLPSTAVIDVAPRVYIKTPKDGETVNSVSIVEFMAESGDETGPLDVQWFINGVAAGTSASGGSLSWTITASGEFTAEARSTDPSGKVGSHTIKYYIAPNPPGIRIVLPATEGETVYAGLPVDLLSQVDGRPPIPPCGAATWSATQGTVTLMPDTAPCSNQVTFLNPGTVAVTTKFSDVLGVGSATRTVNVVNDGRPHVAITAPKADELNGAEYVAMAADGATLILTAAAVPAGVTYPFTWSLTDDKGITSVVPGSTASISYAANFGLGGCEGKRVKFTAMIADAAGQPAHDDVIVIFHSPTCDPP